MNLGGNLQLNFIAEFKDKTLEAEYLRNYVNSSKRLVSILVITIGNLFFMTVFVDMLTEGFNDKFILNILIRSVVLMLAIFTSIFIMRSNQIRSIIAFSMFFSIITISSYQFILFLYSGQDFMQQGMAYLLIVYAIFLLPNRWIYAFCFSVSIVAMFFFVASICIKDTPFNQQINVFVYLLSSITLGGMSSYTLNRSRRLQFFRERQLDILSTTDHLTGAYNRQKFDHFFLELLRIVNTQNIYCSIIMFDLDNFKNFNDTHGHIKGDKILKSCVDVINSNIRKQDILVRWGGEEFIILLPSISLQEATTLAERLRTYIESSKIEDDIGITASFGVTLIQKSDTTDTAVSRVDSYLYNAKHNGRNCIFSK